MSEPAEILARLRRGAPALAVWLALACASPHSDALRWPTQREDAPPQPVSVFAASGVSLRADAIEWEPAAVVVDLAVVNAGEGPLELERAGIMLAWNELEYAVEPPDRDGPPQPAKLEIAAGEEGRYRLRYSLGRPLTGPGAELVLRGSSRAGAAIVDLPRLALPPVPASSVP